MRHEGWRVLRSDDDVLHALRTDDKLASDVGELVNRKAGLAQKTHRILEERALGHRDAQRPLGKRDLARHHTRLALLAQHLLKALEREHEPAGGRVLEPLVCEDRVIAAARCDGGRDALRVALEHGARVVVKRVDDREVKAKRAALDEPGQAARELAQVTCTLLRRR